MAKRINEPNASPDRAKVRVFFAELEGNNESVQEALKTMVSAMSRPVRVISDQKANGKTLPLLDKVESEDLEDSVDQVEESEALAEDDSAAQNLRRARGTGKKIDRNAGLELVPNLNFRPSGKPALKEIMDEKGATSDVDTTVLMVHYMQHTMGLSKIGPAHVLTAFKEVGKAVPVDLKATIRNIKKSKMYLNFTDIEDIRMTTQGDNFVEHEMGKSE